LGFGRQIFTTKRYTIAPTKKNRNESKIAPAHISLSYLPPSVRGFSKSDAFFVKQSINITIEKTTPAIASNPATAEHKADDNGHQGILHISPHIIANLLSTQSPKIIRPADL
jgi:hypothetical protein